MPLVARADGEVAHAIAAGRVGGTTNPRIFGTGEMRACIAVLDGIRCGLNSSPYRLATVSRLMAKTNSYRESIISYKTNESDHSPHRR